MLLLKGTGVQMELNVCPVCGSDCLDIVIEESGNIDIVLCTECGHEIPEGSICVSEQ